MEPLKFIYEDEHLFVVSKPACLHSVVAGKQAGPSVAGMLLERLPALALASIKEGDAGLVNRLDYETSGLLLGARSRPVWDSLRKLLLSGQIDKSYLALLEGRCPDKYSLSTYIGGKGRRSKKVRVYKDRPQGSIRSLLASTSLLLEKYLPDKDVSLVRFEIATGRRHQIRAHSAWLGHPLAGDALYGSSRSLARVFDMSLPEGFPSFLLHCERLGFAHPQGGKRMLFTAEVTWWKLLSGGVS